MKCDCLWPTRQQEHLLRAALLRGEPALQAWERWKQLPAADRLQPGSLPLLPLLYKNLHDQGVRDELLLGLKESYLATWVENKYRLEAFDRAMASLHAAGIETLVLKGAALVTLYYRDPGVRVMGDIDIQVKEGQFQACARTLLAAGLTADPEVLEFFDSRFRHDVKFRDPKGDLVADLHCHTLHADCGPGADLHFWESATPVRISQTETRTLSATDHLIHACLHGMVLFDAHPLRWVADAVTIVRTSPDLIDWDRIVSLGEARGLALPLSAALEYLRTTLPLAVPPGVIDRLRRAPVSLSSRALGWTLMRSCKLHGEKVYIKVLRWWATYTKGVGPVGPIQWLRMFPQYAAVECGTREPWRIAWVTFAKICGVVYRKVKLAWRSAPERTRAEARLPDREGAAGDDPAHAPERF